MADWKTEVINGVTYPVFEDPLYGRFGHDRSTRKNPGKPLQKNEKSPISIGQLRWVKSEDGSEVYVVTVNMDGEEVRMGPPGPYREPPSTLDQYGKRVTPSGPVHMRGFSKAYKLRELRRFKGWHEQSFNPDEYEKEKEKELLNNTIVYINQDLVVSKIPDPYNRHFETSLARNIVFDDLSEDWEGFCRNELGFHEAHQEMVNKMDGPMKELTEEEKQQMIQAFNKVTL